MDFVEEINQLRGCVISREFVIMPVRGNKEKWLAPKYLSKLSPEAQEFAELLYGDMARVLYD